MIPHAANRPAAILIVSDDIAIAEAHRRSYLASGLHHFSVKTTTLELCASMEPAAVDLLLLDVATVDARALEAADRLRHAGCPRAAFIVLVPPATPLPARQGDAGQVVLRKPVDAAALAAVTDALLRARTLEAALAREAAQLQDARDRIEAYRSGIESSAEPIFIVDAAADSFLDLNRAACALLGASRDTLLHASVRALGLPADPALGAPAGDAHGEQSGHALARIDGSTVQVALQYDGTGQATARGLHAFSARDLSLQSDAEQRLRQLADFDTLTGLPNRRQFQLALSQNLAYAKKTNYAAAVMFIDLDRFKIINDNLGHGVGDLLLKELGARLLQCARTRDLVARLGGDEFAILITYPPATNAALVVASKVREALSKPFMLRGHALSVTASIGIAIYPDDAVEPDMLMQYADIAMYRSKESGRNNYHFFTREMNVRGLERLNLETALRHAIDEDQFRLFYQPKIDARSSKVCGMEALLRWERPGHGIVSPAEFIPVLEETGLIVRVGAWVIETACRQLRIWQDQGLDPVPVAVNVSARQFYGDGLKHTIEGAVAASGIDPELLVIELTESALMSDVDEMVACLLEIKQLGVKLAIDDFGTGYSSLSYLKRFPIDIIKIDIAFVRDIITNPEDAAIALAIISMAHGLSMRTVAEGVESEGQLNYLRTHACDELQGYFFSRPVPAGQIPALLLASRGDSAARQADNRVRPCVLIVDDEPDICEILALGLDDMDWTILTATDTAQAFTLLANHDVNIVLCDQRMPQMSGSEFLRRVKTLYPATARIAMSASSDRQVIADAINEGAIFKFLQKPLHLADVKKLLLSVPMSTSMPQLGAPQQEEFAVD